MKPYLTIFAFLLFTDSLWAATVTTVEELVAAAAEEKSGAVIELAAGTFKLTQPLDLKSGTTLKGAGIGKTIITHAENWQANPATLPDSETDFKKFDRTGYLLRCERDGGDITVAHMTLTGPQMHGAIFGFANKRLHFHDLHIEDFMYNGIRTFSMTESKINDCTFVNPGMRWEKGQPGLNGGLTGGAVFGIWMADTEIWNCRFLNTRQLPHEHFYGIKGRQAKRVRIHHNTIETGFSIELPFENDEDVEIDHNILHHAVSIPKYAGGPVPKSGRTFHIHHNYFRDSYSIEFVRNGVEIDHNLFDFDAAKDHGNLIAAFGKASGKGPAKFHNNLVSNPGRGVVWMNEPYAQLKTAVRAAAPKKLFLGERFVLRKAPDAVLKAVGKHVDVFCTQALILSRQRPPEWQVFQKDGWDHEAALTGKPILIVDWAQPFSLGAAFESEHGLLKTEPEAAAEAAKWITDALSHPAIVGVFRCQLAGTHPNDRWFVGKAKRTYLRDDGTPFPTFADKIREANRTALQAAYQRAAGP